MAETCLSKTDQNYQLSIQKFGEKGVKICITQPCSAAKRWIGCCILLLTCLIALYFWDEGIWIPVWIAGFALIIILWKLSWTVTEESLLVLKSVGLQVKLTYLLGYSVNHFLDVSSVQDVVINEAVKMNAQPPLSTLENIYRVVKPLLVDS